MFIRFLVEDFFFFWCTSFWAKSFLRRGQVLILLQVSCMWWVTLLLLLWILFTFGFQHFEYHMSLNFFVFILFRVCWDLCMCRLMVSIKFELFSLCSLHIAQSQLVYLIHFYFFLLSVQNTTEPLCYRFQLLYFSTPDLHLKNSLYFFEALLSYSPLIS